MSSGHPLCNVEQYPSNLRIRFRENRFATQEVLKDVDIKLHKELSDCVSSREHYSKIVSNCTLLLDELSNSRKGVRSLRRELRLLNSKYDVFLSSFVSFAESVRLSRGQISLLVSSLESDGAIYGVLFGHVAREKVGRILQHPFVVVCKRIFEVRTQLAFLSNPDKVSVRGLELDKKIVDAKAERSLVVERFKFLSSQLVQFEKFVKVLNRVLPVEYIFSMFDEELFVRREITCFHNIDMRFVDSLLLDISFQVSDFNFSKYLIISSLADDVDFMSAVKDFNDPLFSERYVSLFKDIRVVTFTQQFPSLLSNLLDLNVIVDADLIRRIRLMIHFSTWLFQQDFFDTRSLSERQDAWVKDLLEKADRVEDAGSTIDMLVGGSLRHKEFRKNI